jgi:receptor expression-enhancing protein 5/6
MSSTTFVQQLTQKFEQFLQKEDNIFTKTLAKIESSTNISRLYLANSLIIIFVSYMIFGYFAQLICNTIGFIYPAYASLVALDLPQTEENLQIKQLLRY